MKTMKTAITELSIDMKKALVSATRYANDFGIQQAGVTVDGFVVTTKMCVDYQIKKNTLLYRFDGNWKFETFKEGGCGWRQTRKCSVRRMETLKVNDWLIRWNPLFKTWQCSFDGIMLSEFDGYHNVQEAINYCNYSKA